MSVAVADKTCVALRYWRAVATALDVRKKV